VPRSFYRAYDSGGRTFDAAVAMQQN